MDEPSEENSDYINDLNKTDLSFGEIILANLNDLNLTKMEEKFSNADEILGHLQTLQAALMLITPDGLGEEMSEVFLSSFIYDPGEINFTDFNYVEDASFSDALYEYNCGQLFRARSIGVVRLTEAFCSYDFAQKMALMFISFDTFIKTIKYFRLVLDLSGIASLQDQGDPQESAIALMTHSPFSLTRNQPFHDALQLFVTNIMREEFIDNDQPYGDVWYDTWADMKDLLVLMDTESLSLALFDIISIIADALTLKCRLENDPNLTDEIMNFMEDLRVEATSNLLDN